MFKYVVEALDSKDNLKDQMILLREYRYRKGVRKYIDNLIYRNHYHYTEHKSKEAQYILYCIVKYYYDLDAKEVKPPKGYEDFKLTEYYYPRFYYEEEPITDTPLEELKIGDRFTILCGGFKGLEALIDNIDYENEKLSVFVDLFGQETKLDMSYKEWVEKRHERKKRTKRTN